MDKVEKKLDGKSIQQIFDEFDPSLIRKPVEEGEVDGVKYQLFDPIDEEDKRKPS